MTMTHPSPASSSETLAAERIRFRHFLVGRVGTETEAADFLANSFIRAIRCTGTSDDRALLSTWLAEVLGRAVSEHLRNRRTRAAREHAWTMATAAVPADDERAIRSCIVRLIPTLPPSSAAMLQLVELNGASLWTAAVALGIDANAAWNRLRRGRTVFRLRLEYFCRDCVAEFAPAFARETLGVAPALRSAAA